MKGNWRFDPALDGTMAIDKRTVMHLMGNLANACIALREGRLDDAAQSLDNGLSFEEDIRSGELLGALADQLAAAREGARRTDRTAPSPQSPNDRPANE